MVILPSFLKFILLAYSCFAMLCQFLPRLESGACSGFSMSYFNGGLEKSHPGN